MDYTKKNQEIRKSIKEPDEDNKSSAAILIIILMIVVGGSGTLYMLNIGESSYNQLDITPYLPFIATTAFMISICIGLASICQKLKIISNKLKN